jgi:ankyrin repeat protein
MKYITSVLLALTVTVLAVSCVESNGEIKTNLITAIDVGDVHVVQQHMNAGVNLNEYSKIKNNPLEGAYPLHWAVVKGHGEIAQILLNNGASIDIEAKNKDGATPLHWATFFQQRDMVYLLIKNGAKINKIDLNNSTPTDTAFVIRVLNQKDPKATERIDEIIAILKENGGVMSKDLQ